MIPRFVVLRDRFSKEISSRQKRPSRDSDARFCRQWNLLAASRAISRKRPRLAESGQAMFCCLRIQWDNSKPLELRHSDEARISGSHCSISASADIAVMGQAAEDHGVHERSATRAMR